MTTLAFGLDATTYLTFCGAAVAPILASSPDTVYVLTHGLDGRGPGIRLAPGIATGVLSHTLLATVGAATSSRTVPEAAAALKYVDAAYLGYLGIASFQNDGFDPSVETDARVSSRRNVPVNALNPKVALFFLTFLPGFAGQGAGVDVGVVGLGAACAVLTALHLSVVTPGVSRLGSRLAETRVASTLNYVGAGTMLLLGVVLALE